MEKNVAKNVTFVYLEFYQQDQQLKLSAGN